MRITHLTKPSFSFLPQPYRTPWCSLMCLAPFWAVTVAHIGFNLFLTQLPFCMDSILGCSITSESRGKGRAGDNNIVFLFYLFLFFICGYWRNYCVWLNLHVEGSKYSCILFFLCARVFVCRFVCFIHSYLICPSPSPLSFKFNFLMSFPVILFHFCYLSLTYTHPLYPQQNGLTVTREYIGVHTSRRPFNTVCKLVVVVIIIVIQLLSYYD